MRILNCTAALLLLASGALAQAPDTQLPVDFSLFLNGALVGTEQVSVVRGPDGVTVRGTSRLGAPMNVTIRSAQVSYDASGRPIECSVEGTVGERIHILRTTVSGTSARTDIDRGAGASQRTDEIAPDALLLPNLFFGSHEELAWRLGQMKIGDTTKAFVPLQTTLVVRALEVHPERIRTPAGMVEARRFRVELRAPDGPLEAEVWVDANRRLIRLVVPAQSIDFARSDIVSVASRREPVARPNDEQVRMLSNGFDLAGTLSRPVGSTPPPAKGKPKTKVPRLPAIVLVAGASPVDRDETAFDVPILGQLSSALADLGFLVVRYDKRGIGQSGGRMENVTLADYAEDTRAAVKYLRGRKDVDRKRVALVGYGDGGAVALTAASGFKDASALVLIGAPGQSGAELFLEQQRRTLSGLDLPEAEKQAKIALQKQIQSAVLTGKGWESIPPALRKQAETAWFQSYLAFDPARAMKKLKQPVLIVQPALDREIEAGNAEKLQALARARKGRKPPRVTKMVTLPGLNHLLVPATTGEVDEYRTLGDKTVSPTVAATVGGWLNEIAPKR